MDLEGSNGLFGRVPRMDLGRSLENLWSPRGIWELIWDLGGFQGGGSGKDRSHNPPVRGAMLVVNSHQAGQRPQTRVKGSAS